MFIIILRYILHYQFIDVKMVVNEKDIVPLLLCRISNVLPEDPVVSEQGEICDRKEFVKSRGVSESFHSCKELRQIIDLLLVTGQVEDKYVGAWAKNFSLEKRTDNNGTAHAPNIVNVDAGVEDSDSKGEHDYFLELKRGAEGGDNESMVKLGELYLAGIRTVEKDEREGYKWFEKAAESGYDLGIARMADCLLQGIGIESDYEEALEVLFDCRNSGK